MKLRKEFKQETIKRLSKSLNNNMGLVESFLNNISEYVDYSVNNDSVDEDDLESYFWDVVYENYNKSDAINDFVKILKQINKQYTNNIKDSFGYVAELMTIYYLSEYGKTNNESKTNKNMKKNTVKLNESQLKKIVAESVRKVLKENQPLWGNEIHPSPYQDTIDKLVAIYQELYNDFRDSGDGTELSQSEANQLEAANYISKAIDLLRYPEMRRDYK